MYPAFAFLRYIPTINTCTTYMYMYMYSTIYTTCTKAPSVRREVTKRPGTYRRHVRPVSDRGHPGTSGVPGTSIPPGSYHAHQLMHAYSSVPEYHIRDRYYGRKRPPTSPAKVDVRPWSNQPYLRVDYSDNYGSLRGLVSENLSISSRAGVVGDTIVG